MNQRNNWEYRYNGHLVAKFVPQSITQNISIKLPKKDIPQLPKRDLPQPVPTLCLVDLQNTRLGELIINPNTYQIGDEIIVTYNSNIITGTIDSPLLVLV